MKIQVLTLRLDEDLIKHIDADVKKFRTSRSEIIRQLLFYNYGLIEDCLFGKIRKEK